MEYDIESFATNLTLLCSYHKSITDICRRLGINRQQFNKYLNNTSRPSRHNMRKICDFFGVSQAELFLDFLQFEEIISLKRQPPAQANTNNAFTHLMNLNRASQSMARYVGFYYRYFYSFSYPGMIIKSLASITEKDGFYYWKNIEKITESDKLYAPALNKYAGLAFFLSNRLYISEYESRQYNSMTQLILYPSYRTQVSRLVGIQTGGPVRRGRRPAASKVVLQYLGDTIDIFKAFRKSGLYAPDDPEVQPNIQHFLQASIKKESHIFEVEES